MRENDAHARIVVFDGFCHLCSGWARFLGRHRIDPPYQLIPMQSDAGKALLIAHGINPEDPTTFLIVDGDQALTESDAAIHIINALGGVWRAINAARMLPHAWRDGAYRWLARNRYRWFGRRQTCYLSP